MTSRTTKYGKFGICSGVTDGVRLQHLLRAIITMIAPAAEAEEVPHCQDSKDNVLVDADLDGHRYLLVRMPLAERKSLRLSPRELEIVRMVAQGHPNKVIAVVLNISSWTVCTHVRRIFAKLGVSSRAAMVARLAEFGGIAEATVNIESPILPHPIRPDSATRLMEMRADPALIASSLRLEPQRLPPPGRTRSPVGGVAAGSPAAAIQKTRDRRAQPTTGHVRANPALRPESRTR